MDELSIDSRTADLTSDRATRKKLNKIAAWLLTELGSLETASAAFANTKFSTMSTVVVTTARLINLPMGNSPAHSISRPLAVTKGKQGLTGQVYQIANVNGVGLKVDLLIKTTDVEAFEEAIGASVR